MPMPHFFIWTFSAGMMVLAAEAVSGQIFPNKPIRMLTSAAGGGSDFTARLIAQGLVSSVGQQVVVDNRGNIAPEIAAKAPPDGYTLLVYGPPLWLSPLMRDHVPWDPVRDFSAITLAVSAPSVLVVHPSLPVRSVKELIALAKARPGELNYGSGQPGSSAHINSELFKSMAGVDIVRVPYRGHGPALIALISGQVQMMFAPSGSAVPHIKADRLRALAVTSAEPSPLLQGLPTVASSGLPGYESVTITGIFAPAGTAAALVGFLNHAIVRVINRAELKQRFFASGVETVGSSPGQLAAAVKSELNKWGKVIKDAGIHEE